MVNHSKSYYGLSKIDKYKDENMTNLKASCLWNETLLFGRCWYSHVRSA